MHGSRSEAAPQAGGALAIGGLPCERPVLSENGLVPEGGLPSARDLTARWRMTMRTTRAALLLILTLLVVCHCDDGKGLRIDSKKTSNYI